MATEQTPAPGGETPNDAASIQSETLTTPRTGETPGTETTTELSPAEIRKENERLAAALKRANAEAKEHRLAKEELDKIKKAQMTEQERKDEQLANLQKAHDEAIRAHQEYKINSEVKLQAVALGINPKHLDKVARLIDLSEVEYDDGGAPKNIRTLLEALTKDWPELIPKAATPAPTGGGATAPARSQVESGDVTESYVADVLSGKIDWHGLSPERKTAFLNYRAKNPHRF